MIQLQFHSANTNSQFIKPAPPCNPNINNTHRRGPSFASRILKHGGPARDTTIQAATKATAREKSHFTKTFSQMDDIMAEFAAEMAVIERIKKEVISNQQRMVQRSLEWYSALSIQMLYRRMRSKLILKALKKGRLIANWLRFRVYFRLRSRAAKRLAIWGRSWTTRRKFMIIVRVNLAARKIQKRYKSRRNFRIMMNRIQVLLTVKKFQRHVYLFGLRRAVKKIELERNPISPEIEKLKPFRSFMMACLRKRRLRLLRSNQGKVMFYVLSMFYSTGDDQSNYIIDYIRRKIGRSLDPPGSSGFIDRSLSSSSSSSNTNRKLQLSRGKTVPRGINSAFGNPAAATPIFSANDLPSILLGFFRLRSIYDTYQLIKDMIKVALANPILVDDSIIPTPITAASKHGTRKHHHRKPKPAEAQVGPPTNSSPGAKGGAGLKGKYGNSRTPTKSTVGSKANGKQSQSSPDDVNKKGNGNNNGEKSTPNSIRNTMTRNIKTPNSIMSNESRTSLPGIEYENTDSSSSSDEDDAVGVGNKSFSPPGTANVTSSHNATSSTPVTNNNMIVNSNQNHNHNQPQKSTSDSQGRSSFLSPPHISNHLHSPHHKRLSSVSEDVASSPTSDILNNSSPSMVLANDASLLSIKTDVLSSSLTYSDAGSDMSSINGMNTGTFDTPFKHLATTGASFGTPSSLAMSMTTDGAGKSDFASSTIASNITSFYIAEQDSDSDFEMEIPEAYLQELLSPQPQPTTV